jgi:hypothetical protein
MKDWRYAVVSFSSDMFVVIEFERPRAALEPDSPEAAWAEWYRIDSDDHRDAILLYNGVPVPGRTWELN